VFATVPTLPVVDFASTLSASTVNQWRAFFPQAVDGVGGGTYSLTAPLIFAAGGDTVSFLNPVRVDATGSMAIGANVTLKIEDDATIDVDPGGLISLIGSLGNLARLNVGSLAKIDVQSAGLIEFQSGATLTIDSGATVGISSGAAVSANIVSGSWVWGNGTAVVHASGSTCTLQSGSTLTSNSGATVTFGSAVTCNGNATLTSAVTMSGNVVLSSTGTLVQSGPRNKNGSSGYDELRAKHTASAAGETIDITEFDLVEIPTNQASGATVNYPLTSSGSKRVECLLYVSNAASFDPTVTVNIKQGSTTLVSIGQSGSNQRIAIRITFDGTIMIPQITSAVLT
jgi:hypothetical protein